MKKKLVFIMTVALFVVSACLCLVGCAPATHNKPAGQDEFKNPREFLEAFEKADAKFVYSIYDDRYIALSGNIIYEYSGLLSEVTSAAYYIIENDNIRIYRGIKDGKDEMDWIKYIVGKDEDIVNIKDYYNNYVYSKFDLEEYDFDNDFEKIGDWYVGKEDSWCEGEGVKINGKEMIMQSCFDEEEMEYFDVKLVIGYEKITIPKEALDAPEVEY